MAALYALKKNTDGYAFSHRRFYCLVFSLPAAGLDIHSPTFCQALLHIQDALVPAAPEGDLQAFFSQQERAVDKHIDFFQKGLLLRRTADKLPHVSYVSCIYT